MEPKRRRVFFHLPGVKSFLTLWFGTNHISSSPPATQPWASASGLTTRYTRAALRPALVSRGIPSGYDSLPLCPCPLTGSGWRDCLPVWFGTTRACPSRPLWSPPLALLAFSALQPGMRRSLFPSGLTSLSPMDIPSHSHLAFTSLLQQHGIAVFMAAASGHLPPPFFIVAAKRLKPRWWAPIKGSFEKNALGYVPSSLLQNDLPKTVSLKLLIMVQWKIRFCSRL